MRVLLFVLAILFMFQAQAGNKNEKKMRSYSVSGKVVGGEDGLTGVKVMLDNKETVVFRYHFAERTRRLLFVF